MEQVARERLRHGEHEHSDGCKFHTFFYILLRFFIDKSAAVASFASFGEAAFSETAFGETAPLYCAPVVVRLNLCFSMEFTTPTLKSRCVCTTRAVGVRGMHDGLCTFVFFV